MSPKSLNKAYLMRHTSPKMQVSQDTLLEGMWAHYLYRFNPPRMQIVQDTLLIVVVFPIVDICANKPRCFIQTIDDTCIVDVCPTNFLIYIICIYMYINRPTCPFRRFVLSYPIESYRSASRKIPASCPRFPVQDSLFLNACATYLTLTRQTSRKAKSLPRSLGIFAHCCYRCVVQKGSCKIHLLQISALQVLPSQIIPFSWRYKFSKINDITTHHIPHTCCPSQD